MWEGITSSMAVRGMVREREWVSILYWTSRSGPWKPNCWFRCLATKYGTTFVNRIDIKWSSGRLCFPSRNIPLRRWCQLGTECQRIIDHVIRSLMYASTSMFVSLSSNIVQFWWLTADHMSLTGSQYLSMYTTKLGALSVWIFFQDWWNSVSVVTCGHFLSKFYNSG